MERKHMRVISKDVLATYALTKYRLKRSAERGRLTVLTSDGACHMTFPLDASDERLLEGLKDLLKCDEMMANRNHELGNLFKDPQS